MHKIYHLINLGWLLGGYKVKQSFLYIDHFCDDPCLCGENRTKKSFSSLHPNKTYLSKWMGEPVMEKVHRCSLRTDTDRRMWHMSSRLLAPCTSMYCRGRRAVLKGWNARLSSFLHTANTDYSPPAQNIVPDAASATLDKMSEALLSKSLHANRESRDNKQAKK